ncbi:deleted in malignant brain tumors 1 protein-like isoform X2 [Dreissena polymorpha]|uniref:deleted in malignant brain tumors 1 protein-like isoform X2 n=1 Tax=Dreissena polymorpha TaxID=45954 RepID=UPI00226501F7|nr:deleted in malignant brain tumors 1 protein-like isoform X2 [Dreissena polymorpha]
MMDYFSLLVFGLFLLPLACTETQVRLVQDGSAYQGYVEILHDGQWRALCSQYNPTATETANVICGMLRNTTQYTVNATLSSFYNPYMTSGISLPNLRCGGDEMDILFCKSDRWSVQGICPNEVVHVSCNTQVTWLQNMVNGGVVGNPYTMFHICQDYFSHADATVYCRTAYRPSWNVNYTTGAYTDYSSYKLRLGCQGKEEDVSECNVYETYCNGNPYNGVIIYCKETEIIFRNGRNKLHGTFSVYENGSMRYICSDGFGPNEARVLCLTINGTAVPGKITRSYVGSNNDFITNLRCHGTEDDISMCTSTWNGYCSSGYAAAVDCNQVRLMDGHEDSSGRLEIYNTSSDSWSTVCLSAGFSYAVLNVVCSQLGFSNNGYNGYNTRGSGGKGDIFTSVFNCHGDESDLNDCIVDHHRSVHCSHQEDIYLNCGNHYTTQTATASPTQVRLVGGGYNSGRVEVYYEGQWGTVCARNFDYRDMEVICRTLGYYSGGGRYYTGNAGIGGNVMIEHLDCHGNESHLDQCPSKTWLSNTCDHSEDISVDCGYYDYTSTQHMPQSNNGQATDGDIRLANGGNDHGRLEVYYNKQWGTVCMRGFDYNDARTVCRILGLYQGDSYLSFYNAINAYGFAYTNILVEDLRCQGDEWSLAQCDSGRPWTNTTCDHYSDVGVSCRGNYYATSTSGSAMSSQYSQCGGHFYGTSGLIKSPNYPNNYGNYEDCTYYINVPSGFSICLQFGTFVTEQNYDVLHIYDGPSTGNQELESLSGSIQQYTGNQCSSGNYLTAHFRTDGSGIRMGFEANYTAVRLNARDDIRLVDGQNKYTGRVEIFHNGHWGTVCNDEFGYEEVVVVCRMLGVFQGQGYGRVYTPSVKGTGPIWLDDLGCHGHEYSLDQCSSRGWGSHNCNHEEDVGVNCIDYSGNYVSEYTTQYNRIETASYQHSMTTDTNEQVRLVNGSNYHSGRVEVYHNGQWGTICDDNFDHLDVMVICRMLGLYQGSSYGQAYSSAYFGQGSSQIWLDSLECNGYESSLSQCSHQSWGSHDCGHSEDAGLDCYAYMSETTMVYHTTGFPWWQTTYNPWWQTTAGYTVQDAIRVGCSERGWNIQVDMGMLRRVYPSARASDIYLGENTCLGVDTWYYVMFQQGLRECLTSETVRHDVLVYSNQLVYAERDPVHSFIIRHYNWTVGVECDVQRNESSSGHIEHENNNHQGGPLVSGASHYTVNLTFYLDPNFQQPVPSNPLRVPVGTDVYVKVFTQATDWTVKMRVHTCYTKPSPTSPDHLRYNLIQNGCEVDTNTHLISQSTHETRFLFKDFEYTSDHQGIHVMCDATFCSTSDYSRQCTQTCNPTIRRNVNVKPVDDVTKSSFDVTAEGVRGSDSKTDEHEAADVEQTKSYENHA